jgi:hypothetical protein
MATTITRSPIARPAKDEWGVYDPQQAGLAALYARLDTKDSAAKTVSPVSSLSRKPAPAVTEKKAEVAPARPAPRIVK